MTPFLSNQALCELELDSSVMHELEKGRLWFSSDCCWQSECPVALSVQSPWSECCSDTSQVICRSSSGLWSQSSPCLSKGLIPYGNLGSLGKMGLVLGINLGRDKTISWFQRKAKRSHRNGKAGQIWMQAVPLRPDLCLHPHSSSIFTLGS